MQPDHPLCPLLSPEIKYNRKAEEGTDNDCHGLMFFGSLLGLPGLEPIMGTPSKDASCPGFKTRLLEQVGGNARFTYGRMGLRQVGCPPRLKGVVRLEHAAPLLDLVPTKITNTVPGSCDVINVAHVRLEKMK